MIHFPAVHIAPIHTIPRSKMMMIQHFIPGKLNCTQRDFIILTISSEGIFIIYLKRFFDSMNLTIFLRTMTQHLTCVPIQTITTDRFIRTEFHMGISPSSIPATKQNKFESVYNNKSKLNGRQMIHHSICTINTSSN